MKLDSLGGSAAGSQATAIDTSLSQKRSRRPYTSSTARTAAGATASSRRDRSLSGNTTGTTSAARSGSSLLSERETSASHVRRRGGGFDRERGRQLDRDKTAAGTVLRGLLYGRQASVLAL